MRVFSVKNKTYKKIAVMILGPLGDVINTSGVFRQLKKSYPESEISIITTSIGAIASKGIFEISNVYLYEKTKGSQGISTMLNFGKVMQNKFDLLVILDNSFRSALLGYLTGTPKRVGRRGEGRLLLLTDSIPYKKEEKNLEVHITEHYARCLKPLGIYEENITTHYEYTKEDENIVNKLLEENNLKGKKLLGYCPICHNLEKSMSVEDSIETLKLIKAYSDYEVIILGGADVSRHIKELKEECGDMFFDFTGKTTFPQSACLVDKCSKFISVDTSLMHLALALNVPTVSVFFTNIFKKWGPKDLETNRLILNLESKKISPDSIFEKFKQIKDKSFS